MLSLVIPTSLAAGVPLEQAAIAKLITAITTHRILLAADLTVLTPFRGVFMCALHRARGGRRRRSLWGDHGSRAWCDQAAIAVAEQAGQAAARDAENDQQQHALDGARRGIGQIL